MSIKTIHITNYYHQNSGGISTSLNNLLKYAEEQRRNLSLVVPGEKDKTDQVGKHTKIYYVKAIRSPLFDKRYRLITPWKYTLKNSRIRQILLAEKPDLIEITDKYTLIFIGLMIRKGFFSRIGRPILVHFSAERMDDNVASFITKKPIGKVFARNYIASLVLPFFDFHIANSEYTASEFFEAESEVLKGKFSSWLFEKSKNVFSAPSIPLNERVFVCPRGVNTLLFSISRKKKEKRRAILEKLGLPNESKLLLYAGRLSPEKNLKLLIETLEKLLESQKDFRLLVAGSGPEQKWLEEKARTFDKKLILLGHLEKEALADYYANVDVFIHPNPNEPFGNTVLEAMASGCAVVAPNSGGILTYANQQNAWLVEPIAEKFVQAIEEVLENENLRRSKIERAIEIANKNSLEKFSERLFKTYDKIHNIFQENRDIFTTKFAKLGSQAFFEHQIQS